jgi:hypothetical protein
VWTPLGDFFGTAPGINKYKSLPLGMTDEGFYCYWYMPFAKRAVIKLTNDGRKRRSVRFTICHDSCANADKLLRFHAKWHRDAWPFGEKDRYVRGDRYPDWPLLITKGRGRFCGVHLHVWNPNPFGKARKGLPPNIGEYPKEILAVMNAAGNRWWWGEGDEKFFVDNEKFPSTFGTGSEDYFGYAWAAHNPVEFESALQNQPLNKNNSLGHVSNNRFQIADGIPFQKSFEACIEKYHPNEWPLLYSSIAYWYQAPGGNDPYGPVPVDRRVDYYVEPEKPRPVKGLYEGETNLKVVKCEGGDAVTQRMRGFGPGWSGSAHMLWRNGTKGSKLTLEFEVDEKTEYGIELRLTKAPDYGIFRFSIDGKKILDSVDLYDPKVVPAPPLDAGRMQLDKGKHKLLIEIIGANPKTKAGHVGKHLLGLDYMKLRK